MSNEQKKLPGAESDGRTTNAEKGAAAAQPDGGRGEKSAPAKELTPEEQMALYEDDLKENDWGHQPC